MSPSAGAEEDQVSETSSIACVPGDEISVDFGEFEHYQNLIGVRAVYAHQSNTRYRIELSGNVESVSRPSRDDLTREPRVSRATASEIVGEDVPPGRYWFQGIEAYTYSGKWIGFERNEERMAELFMPSMIHVQEEPMTNPRLL